jgi:hypothetical protein
VKTPQSSDVADPFWDLLCQTQDGLGRPHTKVSCMTGDTVECVAPDGSKSWPKCEFTVECVCPQTSAHLSQAAELVHRTAVSFVNNAMMRMVPNYKFIILE